MRTLLVMIGMLATAPLYGEERTWTIARDVFTTKAELVAVRGDLAYLKIDGKIEQYPIIRLSGADQRYIASLSLAPVLPGPGDETTNEILPTADAAVVPSVLPTPGGPTSAGPQTETSVLRSGPMLAPAVREEAIPLPPGIPTTGAAGNQGRTSRSSNYGSAAPPSTMSNQTPYRATNTQPLNSAGARRGGQSQQQSQQSQQLRRSTTAQQNQQGLLNLRSRQNDRSRGR